jgi:uncharacterized protein (TIGR02594 family)
VLFRVKSDASSSNLRDPFCESEKQSLQSSLGGKMIPRRRAIFGALATLLTASTSRAQDDDWQRALKDAIDNKNPVTLGHILPPPDDKSWKEAHAILSAAPSKATPFEVARYFVTSVPTKYQQAWPEPDPQHPTFANPLIVLLFLATKTTPCGDVTAWCSAFVNWCLTRVGVVGTANANSQSFVEKNWGEEVWSRTAASEMPTSAVTGDIAIFQDLSKPTQGHVCFFSKISNKQPKSIEVLGGNQIIKLGKDKIHLIDVTALRTDGNLQLRSIRTRKGLRRV